MSSNEPRGGAGDLTDELANLNLVGESPVFQEALRVVRRLACCDAIVLMYGETGTGKELAARAVHYLGSRRNAPFVPVNCGAIPDSLLESEFFGHARGAFTDAREARAGIIAQAEGGTLFLDEVEAMTPRAQVVILRFLQDREYRPVGAQVARAANVRVVAASNADLASLTDRALFRQDLLFRLNVLALHLPPLRDRGDDVVLLAERFLARFCRQYGKRAKRLSADAIAALRHHDWPGNVRELENLLLREVLLHDADVLHLTALRTPGTGEAKPRAGLLTDRAFREAKAHAIATFERAYIAELLDRTRGNLSAAARLAGKERSRFGKLVKKYRLQLALPPVNLTNRA
jgi:DNA-binding NtrC family response regulator